MTDAPPPDDLIRGLEKAVVDAPDNAALRIHLIEVLLDAGRAAAALGHCEVLVEDGSDERAVELRDRAWAALHADSEGPLIDGSDEVADLVEADAGVAPAEASLADPELEALFDIVRPEVTLQDVAGMGAVKERIEMGFLEPLRNEELRRLYGKSLRTGLLLYGPPGCGKTFMAKALAGELGLYFISIGITDVLDMWVGNSEKNVAQLFATAREMAPSVVFLDEIDALGHRRSKFRADSVGRNVVNQLLSELDGVESAGDAAVMVVAATNQPWDVDPALRRPGRFDRLLLVLPPDAEARAAIVSQALRERPTEEIDSERIAARTDMFSGADLVHLVETATEYALMDSIRADKPRRITETDLDRAVGEISPSTVAWFRTAKNYAEFANDGGMFDELLAYIRQHRL